MPTTLRHITPLVTVAAALSIWTAPIAAADAKLDGLSCREVTDTGECVAPGHRSDAAPEIPYTPRQPYSATLRDA
jgi:hypothetical protein